MFGEGKKNAKAREKNEVAYCELVLSISTRESLGKLALHAVKSSKTQDLQRGDAYLAWTQLCQRYGWSGNKLGRIMNKKTRKNKRSMFQKKMFK